MSTYEFGTTRSSRARQRAMQSSTVSNTFMDNTRSHSTSRIRSEVRVNTSSVFTFLLDHSFQFHRDSPFGGREFGVPDYRSSSIEIRTTSPCLGAGGYYPRLYHKVLDDQSTQGYIVRTTKRQISITTQHHNDQVPVLSHGYDATRTRHLMDKTTAYPASDRDTLRWVI